ncbi:putative alpha/beta hydrolase [Sphingobium sp. SYK-6]|nr:putative alpha/beta hydrolase [Sphingobium sp. SYK-6]
MDRMEASPGEASAFLGKSKAYENPMQGRKKEPAGDCPLIREAEMNEFSWNRRAFLLAGGAMGTAGIGAALTGARAATRDGGAGTAHYVTGSPQPDLPPMEVTLPGAVARLDGVDLWYWDTGGAGPAVVLLHPATGSGHVWGYQQAALSAAGYRVIGYSRRGHRGSSPVDPAAPGTGVEDLRMLVDHLGLRDFHLVGTAAGGFLAGGFALAQPERLKSLTIACSIVSVADPQVRALVPWLYEAWWNALAHDLRELSPSYRATNRAGHARWNELHDLSRGDNPEVNQPAGLVASLDTMARITVPTQLIYGDADLISPPPIARKLQAAIPGSALTILTECGHSAYWERPAAFNQALLDFFKRQAS